MPLYPHPCHTLAPLAANASPVTCAHLMCALHKYLADFENILAERLLLISLLTLAHLMSLTHVPTAVGVSG